MNRLHAEFDRLYLPHPTHRLGADADVDAGADADVSGLIDAQGRVRALVLELARPADWDQLSQAWRGAQADLGLPAPAIAVSGTDGLQLWFSLAAPVSVPQAHAFLESLRSRYLPDVAPGRLRLLPALDTSSSAGALVHARQVPALHAQTGNWSVFVASDLVPLFADTPWLDSAPSDEGQANLLRDLDSIKPTAWAAALQQLTPSTLRAGAEAPTTGANTLDTGSREAVSPGGLDPRRFLLAVMNDHAVPLALRIEAAKALLPYPDDCTPFET